MRISDWSSDVCSSDLQRASFLLGGRDLGIEQAGAGVLGALALPYRGRHFAAALDGAHKRADADGQRDGGHRVLLAPVAIPALVLAHVLRGETVGRPVDGVGFGEELLRSAERRAGKEWVSTCRSR